MRPGPVVASLVALAAVAAAADLVVRQRSSMGGATPAEETVYLAGSTIVTESPTARTIVDLDRKTITSIDPGRRTYTVVTFDELESQLQALRKAMEHLPPEARKQMGGLLEDEQPVTLERTGRTETIAGHPAAEYAIRGGSYTGAVWTTDAIPKPPAFRRWKSLEGSGGGPTRQLGLALDRVPGFPLRTRIETRSGGQRILMSNEVIEVKEGPLPPALRTVPAGFSRQTPGTPAAPTP
jgi:hypothetical protein